MKKILLISLFMLSACGVEQTGQTQIFEADFIEVSKSEVCENLEFVSLAEKSLSAYVRSGQA